MKAQIQGQQPVGMNDYPTVDVDKKIHKEANQKMLGSDTNNLEVLLKKCGSRRRRQIYHLAVSERMIQYYLLGRAPTKQALLAIAIILELSMNETEELLRGYGYGLSYSLANDAVVRWFWENNRTMSGADLLHVINDALESMNLPLLMTKQIGR